MIGWLAYQMERHTELYGDTALRSYKTFGLHTSTPPALLYQEGEDEDEVNKSDPNHILCKWVVLKVLPTEIQTHTSH